MKGRFFGGALGVLCFLLWSGQLTAQTLWGDDVSSPASLAQECRAVWLTTLKNLDWPTQPANTFADEQRQQQELCAMLDTLKAVGINTILLQTRLRGDVIYPSRFEPFAAVFTGERGRAPGYDPLRFAIDECHRRGMECHAWMVALRGKDDEFLDPSSWRVIDHLCTMVREVVSTYDVDGVHLDYIRYPEKTHGREQWRRDNVTRCMREVYTAVKRVKPEVMVSAATLGKYRDTARNSSYGWNAYNTVFQDVRAWMRLGYVDAVFPMLYYRGKHFYPFLADWAENTYDKAVVAGLGIYQLSADEQDWPLEEVRSQLSFVRSFEGASTDAAPVYGEGCRGYALFRAGFIMQNTKGIRDELRNLNQGVSRASLVPWNSF